MSLAELDAVLGGLTSGPDGDDSPPIGKVMQALHHRIAAVDAWADEVIARADEVEPAAIAEARADRQAILDELDAAFE